MAFYSRETCDRVRDANNIVDVIGSYVNLKKKGTRYFGLCPFHTEKTGSFCVSDDSQLFHCFGCGESGDVIGFLIKYENMEFPEALETLAERAGISISTEKGNRENTDYRKKRDDILAANRLAAEYYYKKLRDKEGERGLNYFKERGLSPEVMRSFGLGYTGTASHELYDYLKTKDLSDELLIEAGLVLFDEKNGVRDRFFNRVMFPIMDVNRKVIGFGGRVMGDAKPKYLNSQESVVFNKSQTLYGLFLARRSRRKGFILCEGYMDVVSSHMAGFDNAIATLGTALTEGHATVLARLKRPIYLCYDSDEAGKKAARRGYEILKKAGINAKIIDLSPYKDPDEIIKVEGKEGFQKRIDESENAFLAIMGWDYDLVDKNDPDSETNFMHNLAKGIAEFPDEAMRESYMNFSARKFSLSIDLLKRMVNTVGSMSFVRTTERVAKERRRGPDKDKGERSAQGQLLYYLLDEEFYRKTKGIIEESDFTEEGFPSVYKEIVKNHEEKRENKPAELAGILEDGKEKSALIELFVGMEEEDRDKKISGAIKKDLLLRVKKTSFMRQNSNIDPASVETLQKALEISREIIDRIENTNY